MCIRDRPCAAELPPTTAATLTTCVNPSDAGGANGTEANAIEAELPEGPPPQSTAANIKPTAATNHTISANPTFCLLYTSSQSIPRPR